MSAYAQRALIVAFPRTPFTGDALLKDRLLRPAAPKTRPCVLLASAHWGLQSENLEYMQLKCHRLVRQSCGSWAIDNDRTKQVKEPAPQGGIYI